MDNDKTYNLQAYVKMAYAFLIGGIQNERY